MTFPFLSDEEIAGICEPLVQPAAQCKYLRSLGLLVQVKPNGKPLVARSEFERVLGAARFLRDKPQEPNRQVPMGINIEGLRNQFAQISKNTKRGK